MPLPANNDAATGARFTLVEGQADPAGAGLEALHDGGVPTEGDQPAQNFFFQAGSGGGRIQIDLGRGIAVREVNTYSWHVGARGPQVYTLYAADGQGSGFVPEPKRGTDPVSCGWSRLARVDTRLVGGGDGGGQHGVSVCPPQPGTLGRFRYLLLDIEPTERSDPFGNTFYSEIDVVDAEGPPPTSEAALLRNPVRIAFETAGGRCRFTVDLTAASDLQAWSEGELKSAVCEWYPKLVQLLASDGYRPPSELAFYFRDDLGATPASASGNVIHLNAAWIRKELRREALGAVVHELVHAVQGYGRAKRADPKGTPAPGWVVEGIADYVRWFLYEPQSGGAAITQANLASARYDGSYRMSANFLQWATLAYDCELVQKLNAAAREGRYRDALWNAWTGRSVKELGEEWLAAQRKRLAGGR